MTIDEYIQQRLESLKSEILANMEAKKMNASGRTAASFRVEKYDTGFRLIGGGEGAVILISSKLETSTLYVEISFPKFANSSLVLAKPSSLISQIIKLEPPLSKDFLAMILPIPEQPPVISTFLFLKSISINFSFIQRDKILQKSIRFL